MCIYYWPCSSLIVCKGRDPIVIELSLSSPQSRIMTSQPHIIGLSPT